MQSKPISVYISFGEILWFLHSVKTGWSIKESKLIKFLDDFFHSLEEFNLPVTQRAASELKKQRDEFGKMEPNHILTHDEAASLSRIFGYIEEILLAEAQGNIAYIVTDKRIDVNKLLSEIPALMAPGVFDSLPSIAQYDFLEAGKCIAFERPTAAAFHLLRGTEAVLRHLYCSRIKRKRVNLSWGLIVDHLRKQRRSLPEPLLDNLDNIRRSFRNPTQHPEKIYDIQEVQDLFSLCIDVVNRMAKILNKK